MRFGVVLGVALIAVCLALLAWYIGFTRGEAQENRYTNHAEARESQRHGWMPTILPRSASEIHEWHELDKGLCFGSFRFDPGERSAIEPTLHPGLLRPIRIDRDPSFAGPLPRDPSEEQLTSAGFEFYSDHDFGFAINWKDGIAYYWNSPAR